MSESLIFLSKSLIAHFWTKYERFARKTDEPIPSPGIMAVKVTVTEPKVSVMEVGLECHGSGGEHNGSGCGHNGRLQRMEREWRNFFFLWRRHSRIIVLLSFIQAEVINSLKGHFFHHNLYSEALSEVKHAFAVCGPKRDRTI